MGEGDSGEGIAVGKDDSRRRTIERSGSGAGEGLFNRCAVLVYNNIGGGTRWMDSARTQVPIGLRRRGGGLLKSDLDRR